MLSAKITFALTQNFNFAGRLAVWAKPMLSGIDIEQVFVSITTTSESS